MARVGGRPRPAKNPRAPAGPFAHPCCAPEEARLLLTNAGRGPTWDVLVLHGLQCNPKLSDSSLLTSNSSQAPVTLYRIALLAPLSASQENNTQIWAVQEGARHLLSPGSLSLEPAEIVPGLRPAAKAGNLITGEGRRGEMGSGRWTDGQASQLEHQRGGEQRIRGEGPDGRLGSCLDFDAVVPGEVLCQAVASAEGLRTLGT